MRIKIGQKIIDAFRKKSKQREKHTPLPSFESFRQFTYILDVLIGEENINTIFEFGSRYGEDTIEFAKKYPKAKIYAFECNPNTVKKCKKKISKFENIIFKEKALSSKTGFASFFPINKRKTVTTWKDGNQGASSLLRATGNYEAEKYVQDEVKVETTTLKQEMQINNLKTIDAIWMDVQGAEFDVLLGLEDRISDVKIFQIEMEYEEIYTNQPLFNKIKEFLVSKGFRYIGNTVDDTSSGDAVFINTRFFSFKDVLKLNLTKFPNNLKSVFKYLIVQDEDFYNYPSIKENPCRIDVLIPTCDKDMQKLKLVVEKIRENIKHPIGNIYVVAPKGPVESYCGELNCVFVDENTVLPLTVKDLNYCPLNMDRSGWIFQQLLKLSADVISKEKYVLIADSDTLFTKPQQFVQEGKEIFDCSDEYHGPYYDAMLKLGINKRMPLSFVAHHILFNTMYLKELKAKIESFCGKKWYEAILSSLDKREISSFSEYELYGNYMYFNHSDKIKLRYWFNKSTTSKKYLKMNEKQKSQYNSISMHAYLEE